MALCISTAEYAGPVWTNSVHAKQVDLAVNEAGHVTGWLKPTPIEEDLRSHRQARKKQAADARHPLFGHQLHRTKLRSRKSVIPSLLVQRHGDVNCDGIDGTRIRTGNWFTVFIPGQTGTFLQNYRPISLFSTVGKITEAVIFDRLQEELEESAVIPDEQFGIRRQHSIPSNKLSELLNSPATASTGAWVPAPSF